MQTIETEIIINAPCCQVWQALTNFSAYQDWNPFIIDIKGECELGKRIKITIKPEDSKAMSFTPKLIKVKPEQEFRWLGRFLLPKIFDGEHIFKLEALDGQRTRLIHQEKFSGVLVPMVLKKIAASTKQGFLQMNKALQELLEQ